VNACISDRDKRKNQPAPLQKTYCYVCVAKTAPLALIDLQEFAQSSIIN